MQHQTRPAATPPARTGALDVTCVICDRPVPDQAYACPTCTDRLDRDLAEAADLVDDVAIAMARQGRTRTAVRAGGADLIPFDQAAADASHELANTLTTWTRHVLAERGGDLPAPSTRIGPDCPRRNCRHLSCLAIRSAGAPSTLAVAATWLRGQREWIRHRPEVDEAVDDFATAVATARRAIDLPPDRLYVGRCECGVALYVRRGDEEATCRECGSVWGVAEQREWMLAMSWDTLATAAEASRALTALGYPVTAHRIRVWSSRGKVAILAMRVANRRPLYRLGDVADLVIASLAATYVA